MKRTPALIVGSIVDLAGVMRAKVAPADRTAAFTDCGMGASPSWSVFCADDALAFTDSISAVGDVRLRIERSDLRDLGGEVSWAPANLYEQSGRVASTCARSALRTVVSALNDDGLDAMVGHEVEFTLFGGQTNEQWSAYGLGAVLRHEEFVKDLLLAAERAQLKIDQFHAEYDPGQFEIVLAPSSPLDAADNVVLSRILISRVARSHSLSASFSPIPVLGGAGNGAHQHVSLSIGGDPLFSGGPHAHGMTDAGTCTVAGILAHLGDLTAVLAGSPLSGIRLKPDNWSGAHICWGLENREAAVRFCAKTPGNPRGANVEVKVVDPSANPYLATAVILGAAHAGISNTLALPREVRVNPSSLTESESRGITLMPTDFGEVIERLQSSALVRNVLGEPIVDALVSVREREHLSFADAETEVVVDRLRYIWSA